MSNSVIELHNLVKNYGDVTVVNGINLTIYENEFLTILGPSGCGKTTTLRIIGGFENADSGELIVNGKVFNDLPPYARPINTVFQKYALFPHLDVEDNVKFGLQNRTWSFLLKFFGEEKVMNLIKDEKTKEGKDASKISKRDIKKKIDELIEAEAVRVINLVKLPGFEKRKVSNMSGGQQQRVALARALINRPQILLLDEPLAALDLKLREQMQYELKEMQRTLGITFIFVTHDQGEAMTMSDRIVVMNDGIIQQLGTPKDIYNEPVNRFVATFIGKSNIIRGKYVKKDLISFMDTEFDCVGYKFNDNEDVDIVIRPEDWDVVPLDKAKLVGEVVSSIFEGVYYEITALVNDTKFLIHAYEDVKVGDKIGLKVDPYEIHVMKISENFVIDLENTEEICTEEICSEEVVESNE